MFQKGTALPGTRERTETKHHQHGKEPSSKSRSSSRRPSSQNVTSVAEGSLLCRRKSHRSAYPELPQCYSCSALEPVTLRSFWNASCSQGLQLSSQQLLTSHRIGSSLFYPLRSWLLPSQHFCCSSQTQFSSVSALHSAPKQPLESFRVPLVTAG